MLLLVLFNILCHVNVIMLFVIAEEDLHCCVYQRCSCYCRSHHCLLIDIDVILIVLK